MRWILCNALTSQIKRSVPMKVADIDFIIFNTQKEHKILQEELYDFANYINRTLKKMKLKLKMQNSVMHL